MRSGRARIALHPTRTVSEDEADAILFSVGGMGGLPAHGDSFAYQDGYAESEAEPYWATWTLV